MFWGLMIFGALAFAFAQLGAYSVWVAVLAGGLKLALLIIAGLAIAILWQKLFSKNN